MKKTALFLAAAITAASLCPLGASAADDISIVVNGEKITTETPAVIVDERTLVPLRAVSEALGCDVSWDSETKGITLTDNTYLYFTWIGRNHVFKMDSVSLAGSAKLDVAPVIMNDFTMVPLRAISEMFGAEVGWDGSARTVTVDYAKKTVSSGRAAEFEPYEKQLDMMYDAYSAYADGTAGTAAAEIQLENGGVINVELYGNIAPVSVQNFIKLANEGFYNGLVFHRVIPGFMIQGGGFDTSLNQKTSANIKGEFIYNGYFNIIPHERGVLSMARADDMNSASSQFFIMHADYPSLNGKYAAFGRVTSGLEYVDAIANTETSRRDGVGDDVPVENQVIKTIVIK